ncbi:MAG: sugar phosphate nucleotidyltransferase [Clostridia bacterium]|nr:sugar phosphate nucleotidyltransferase [Clostridia bacterium]
MSKKPVLVVMAAGMGSRYGGLKQIDPVGPHGEVIIDYSIYDAKQAGFEKVVFIIKRSIEKDFKEVIGDRVARHMEVEYVFQEQDAMLPEGFTVPEQRTKPWGTAHALLCCSDVIDGPFAAINADDYYGASAYKLLYDRLLKAEDKDGVGDYCMVGFHLDNTLTDNGHVARGICETDAEGNLVNVVERTRVYRTPEGPAYTEDEGKTFVHVPADNLVSMNMWGLTPGVLKEFATRFKEFLEKEVPQNIEKAEYYVPMEIGRMLREGKCKVEVLSSADRWYGVTYHDDKPGVVEALKKMTDEGKYPDHALFA